MSEFLSTKYKKLVAYVPGEQPRDRRYIKLNTNESPYPPSDGVRAVLSPETADRLPLYPDPEATELRAALAERFGVSLDSVAVTNGSDDALNFAFMAYGGDRCAVFPDITYGFYSIFCEVNGVKYEKIPLKDDFSIDPDDYIGKGRLVVIANPNAPTGLALPLAQIERIVAESPDSVIVIDEAYVDFGGETAVKLTEKYKNLLVIGTFSKSRSLAGARLGYAVGAPSLIADLTLLKYSTNPFDVDMIAQKIGKAAIEDDEYYMANCRRIIKTRERFAERLQELGFEVLPSSTNFVFAKHKTIDGKAIFDALRERGILVRRFDGERTRDYNRITVGTEEDMQTVADAMTEIVNEKTDKRKELPL